MKISRTGVWSVGTAVLCVLLLGLAWALVIGPQRAEAEEARLATEVTEAENRRLEQHVADLQADFALLPQRRQELAAIREALPADPALAALLDELDVAAADTAVTLTSVVTSQATTVVDAAVPPPPPADEDTPPTGPDAAAGDPGSAGGEPLDPAADVQAITTVDDPNAVPPLAAAPGAAPGGQVLAAIPVTVTVDGDFFAVASFLETVQGDLVRALVVDSVDVTSGPQDGGTVTATLTGRVFVFVDPQAVDAVEPSGEAPASTTGGTTGSTTGTTGPEATDD